MITIYNIQNLEVFFHMINQFQNPVTLQLKKSHCNEDLRNNDMLQEILTFAAGERGLEKLSLSIEGKEDVDKMVTFLLEKNQKKGA